MVNGVGAPLRDHQRANRCTTPSSVNNENLVLGAGLRFAGAQMTQLHARHRPVIDSQDLALEHRRQLLRRDQRRRGRHDDAHGRPERDRVRRPRPAAQGRAQLVGRPQLGTAAVTPPPPINPTVNPPAPGERGQRHGRRRDAQWRTDLNSVDFFPYRSGPQCTPIRTERAELPVLTAPIPVDDAAPDGRHADRSGERPTAATTITLTAAAARRLRHQARALRRRRRRRSAPRRCRRTRRRHDPRRRGLREHPHLQRGRDGLARPDRLGVRAGHGRLRDGPGAHRHADRDGDGHRDATADADDATPTALRPPTVAFVVADARLGRVDRPSRARRGRPRQVELFLGTRTLCRVTAAPFACTITPTGADVGGQALRVVVTDTLGSTPRPPQRDVSPSSSPRLSVRSPRRRSRAARSAARSRARSAPGRTSRRPRAARARSR